MQTGFGGRYAGLAAPAALLLLGVLALDWAWPFSTQLIGGDWAISASPMFRFNMDVFRAEGVLPLWNPFIYGGMTHLASLLVSALYPTELLALPFSPEPHIFYWLDTFLHLWLAGAGIYWWMRLRGMERAPAFTVALCYMLGGRVFTLAGAGHVAWVRSYALFPWACAFLERGLRDGRYTWAVFAGAVQALSVIATGLHFTVQAMAIAAGWFALRGGGGIRRRAGQYAVFAAVTALLSAVTWFPGMEHFRQSLRADPAAMAPLYGQFNLLFPDFVSLILPDIFGQWPVYWGPQPFGVSSEYFGLVPLALAVLGVAMLGRRGWRWILLGAMGIVLALGPATPVGRIMQEIPVVSGLRAGVRWLFLPYIAGSVLAGFGWEYLVARRSRGGIVAGVMGLFALACLVPALTGGVARVIMAAPFARNHVMTERLNPMTVELGMEKSFSGGAVAGLAAGAAFSLAAFPAVSPAVLAAALWGTAFGDLVRSGSASFVHVPGSYREPDPVARLILGAESAGPRSGPFRVASDESPALANIRMREGIQSVYGYHSLPLSRYYRVFREASAPAGEKLRALLNVRYVVVSRPKPTPIRVDGAQPRVYLAGESVYCRNLDEALAVMHRPGWTPATVPVEGGAAVSGRWDAGGKVDFQWRRDELSARVMVKQPALVVFLETWFPAWKAFVDGKRVPILRACGAFRAVAVPAGDHQIWMAYDSWTLKAGLWCSLLAWTALLMAIPVLLRGAAR